jgi:hypothetical protein
MEGTRSAHSGIGLTVDYLGTEAFGRISDFDVGLHSGVTGEVVRRLVVAALLEKWSSGSVSKANALGMHHLICSNQGFVLYGAVTYSD